MKFKFLALLLSTFAISLLFTSCGKRYSTVSHSGYSPFVGSRAKLTDTYNLYRTTNQTRRIRDFSLDLGTNSVDELIARIPAGTVIEVEAFKKFHYGGIYGVLVLGELKYDGVTYKIEHDIRLETEPINFSDYPPPYTLAK